MAFLVLPYVLSIAYVVVNPPSMLMVWRVVQGKPIDVRTVPIEQISPHIIRAVIAAEDGRFCEHNGIDFVAMRKVIKPMESGQLPDRGASTIPMQVAKNLFLWHGKSLLRKGLEAPIALWIDLVWSKQRLLEVYLNVAEWGEGVFGIEAAAQRYFGVSAVNVSSYQASLLVSALPNPVERNPSRPSEFHAQSARALAARVAAQGANTDCVR